MEDLKKYTTKTSVYMNSPITAENHVSTPCPFCGESADNTTFILFDKGSMDKGSFDMWAVQCGSCDAIGPMGIDATKAGDAWDERS